MPAPARCRRRSKRGRRCSGRQDDRRDRTGAAAAISPRFCSSMFSLRLARAVHHFQGARAFATRAGRTRAGAPAWRERPPAPPAPLRREPAPHALLFHGHGERLVERGIVLRVHQLVRQLVEHEARELGIGIADEGREQRIVEPAQRGIRRHAADVDVVAVRAQLLGMAPRVGLANKSRGSSRSRRTESTRLCGSTENTGAANTFHTTDGPVELGVGDGSCRCRAARAPCWRTRGCDARSRGAAGSCARWSGSASQSSTGRARAITLELPADRLGVIGKRLAADDQHHRRSSRGQAPLHSKRPELQKRCTRSTTRAERISMLWP